ncbi:MAG: GNAT family N-acetyltransferase [Spirochaetia bacterium]|nr:GNAT family N-acetyltransferase [Spirochaetia bacterium]
MPYYTKSNQTPTADDPHLRYGKISDIDFIQKLLVPYAEQGIMLYKDKKKIEKDLPGTVVCELSGNIIGVANLHKYEETLYELRGLTVHRDYQKQGFGKKMIHKLTSDLKGEFPQIAITIFALTVVPDFFRAMGWVDVVKEKFPAKIFDDCSYCVKRDHCFEDAVETTL